MPILLTDERLHKALGLAYYVLRRKPAKRPLKMWYPKLEALLKEVVGQ